MIGLNKIAQSLERLSKSLACVVASTEDPEGHIEQRETCIQIDTACYNAYMIVRVDDEITTTLRVELKDGTLVENPQYVECSCDCIDGIV